MYIAVHLLVFCKYFGNLTLTKEQIILKPLDECFDKLRFLRLAVVFCDL